MINIKTFSCNPFQEKCYIAWDRTGCGVIIDPGCYDEAEVSELEQFIASKGIRPSAILLTHGHFDHIFGVVRLSERYGIPVYMKKEDGVILLNNGKLASTFGLKSPDVNFKTTDVAGGQQLDFGEMSFSVIETPGHTPGGVCYYSKADKVVFTGDSLFAGSIGRTDGPLGDYDKLIVSIMDNIMGIDGDTDVLPGHGPSTTIGYERTNNPFLQPFNEPDDFEYTDY